LHRDYSATEATIHTTTIVKAIHLAEVRSALAEVYAAIGPEPTSTNRLQPGDVITAIDMNETRRAVEARG
jgi:hypothetical protein